MNGQKSTTKGCLNKNLLASVSLSAALVLSRPIYATKVHAAVNLYDWTKHVDLDRMGGSYTSAASSQDGSSLILSVTEGGENTDEISPLYISNNYGASWENVAGTIDDNIRYYWSSVDISNDGQTMVAASDRNRATNDSENLAGKIVISEDGGDTWQDISPAGTESWEEIAISGDGNTIVATEDGWEEGDVFISEDGGDTWAPTDFAVDNYNAKTVSISDDGETILVGGENGGDAYTHLNISEDGGDTWANISPNPEDEIYEMHHALSADGSKIVVADMGWNGAQIDSIFISENDGQDWTDITYDDETSTSWAAIAISDDGLKMSALDSSNDKMYISSNDGQDWTVEDPGQEYEDNNSWQNVDMNSDGSQIIVTSPSDVYTNYQIDSEEESTVTFDDAEGGKTITLTTPAGTTITCHSGVKESGLEAKDSAYSYPLGLVDFCFNGAGESNEVSLVFVTDLKADEVVARKYNPADDGKYTTLDDAEITETTYQGQPALRVTYTIVDNGPLDTDADDGEIADPVGLGVADISVPDTGIAPSQQKNPVAFSVLASGVTLIGGLLISHIRRKLASKTTK